MAKSDSNPAAKKISAAKLLEHVSRRLKLAALVRTTFYTFIVTSLLFLGVFVSSRLMGLFSFEFEPLIILSVPLLAIILALAFQRQPSLQQAARTVDAREETKDLYLTLSLLKNSAGEYQPFVEQAAEEKAKQVRPQHVVPYGWDRRGWFSVSMIVAMVLLVMFAPQLDPFGKIEEAQAVEEKREELNELAEATADRKRRLTKKQASEDLDGKAVSEDVKQAVDSLVDTLNEMKDLERKQNEDALTKQQKQIGQKWNQVRNGRDLKELLKQNTGQEFGRNMQKMRDWADQIRKGDSAELRKKVEELQGQLQKLQKLAKKEDGDDAESLKKKEQLKRQIKKELEQLQEFAKQNGGKNSKLREAVERALEQLDAGESDKTLSDDAIRDALESLELSKMEIEELAKSARDLEQLQKALKAIQQAKQLNQKLKGDQLDGDWGNEPTLEELKQQYAQMLEEMGLGDGQGEDGQGDIAGQGQQVNGSKDGDGKGTGGKGEGGVVGENKTLKTEFVAKKSKAHVQAGKMIFTMKSQGVSEAGDVNVEYQKLIKNVVEGASEVVEQEEIPPGYVPGIKKYFDRIEAEAAAKAKKNE